MPSRLLTINIRKYLVKQPRRKRPARISRYVKERISQQTNISFDNINVSSSLNSLIQKRHLHSMMPIKVNINIDKGKATVTPFSDRKPVEETKQKNTASAASNAKENAATTKPTATKTM